MDINAYLERIGYRGERQPTPQTLFALQRAHLTAIAYENLDIHLDRSLVLDQSAVFDKIVTRHRGGWCYEMNGLFAWALGELGFDVTLLSSAVNREAIGDRAKNNHLILLVRLDQPYLVDVGFGNGFVEPLPLRPGQYRQAYLTYGLANGGERWHFTNHVYGGPGYDFTLEPHALDDFAAKSHELQTSPESGFVRVVVCHRFTAAGMITLRGAILRTITEAGAQDETIEDETTYRRVLSDQFDLHLPDNDLAVLWQIVWQKHQEFLQQQS
ncbi:MAG TPA: arylamine N-acetyltransferase [Aggregatilinea sp.]|uniref:arylamine N-acetyltransferase family protein n=1 Tax=Aggregatilinea sp. TaxID=2806333 RepID=UPI002BB0C4A4|nr:arylamine N-acetyltransferase [Aggregatilinea sp.]HML21159.1 arylamine N-acetyltransferase [Aggregatilinea sp.]